MEQSLKLLPRREATVKSSDGTTYQGTVDIVEDSGIWITLAAAQPAPAAVPAGNLQMFFPFAQMHWLAVVK